MDSINLSLTDELRAFIDQNCGQGTLYSTPSEFLRDLLREKKRKMEAAEIRAGIIEGYQDLLDGRHVEFTGSLKSAIKAAKKQKWIK
jgi:antitoxin ParD1/3/4